MNDITRKLEVLYDLLVDNSNTLEAELIELIANPDGVEDTHKFASLLVKLNIGIWSNKSQWTRLTTRSYENLQRA